jgi:hypothetical protein
MDDLADLFSLPLCVEALAKFWQLQAFFTEVHIFDEHDKWVVFDSSANFKVSTAYKSLVGHDNVCDTLKWI